VNKDLLSRVPDRCYHGPGSGPGPDHRGSGTGWDVTPAGDGNNQWHVGAVPGRRKQDAVGGWTAGMSSGLHTPLAGRGAGWAIRGLRVRHQRAHNNHRRNGPQRARTTCPHPQHRASAAEPGQAWAAITQREADRQRRQRQQRSGMVPGRRKQDAVGDRVLVMVPANSLTPRAGRGAGWAIRGLRVRRSSATQLDRKWLTD